MQIEYRKKILNIISYIVLVGVFYFYNTYATIAGYGVGYQYLCCIIIIILGSFAFLQTPNLMYGKIFLKAGAILSARYWVILLVSAAIWIFTFAPMNQIITGFFEPIYLFLVIFSVVASAYIWRERVAEISFLAMTTAFSILVGEKMYEYGVGNFINALITLVLSNGGDVLEPIARLEDTSLSAAYAFFSIYFLINWKKESFHVFFIRMLICLLAMLIVFKRSAFLALAMGFAAAFMYTLLKKRAGTHYIYLLMFGFTMFSVLVIPLIRIGLLDRIIEVLHINTSGRVEIYRFYSQFYEFNISYMGKGNGWIGRLLRDSFRSSWINVHNDYKRMYIELGFWGYFLWTITIFIFPIKQAMKNIDKKAVATVIGMCVSMAALHITENIIYFHSSVFAMSAITMQCSLTEIGDKREAADWKAFGGKQHLL